MISILDVGIGNLGSVVNMLRKVGADCTPVSTPSEIEKASKLLLPGVGAFDSGMEALKRNRLDQVIRSRVIEGGVPIFGICLGMQLLARSSEEGVLDGLGLLQAHCRRFSFPDNSVLKVPHMGWNHIKNRRPHPLLVGLDEESRFYFVHSYHMVCEQEDAVLATADYGGEFACVVQQGNVMGAQFHPEKSHRFGMQLLKNFAEL